MILHFFVVGYVLRSVAVFTARAMSKFKPAYDSACKHKDKELTRHCAGTLPWIGQTWEVYKQTNKQKQKREKEKKQKSKQQNRKTPSTSDGEKKKKSKKIRLLTNQSPHKIIDTLETNAAKPTTTTTMTKKLQSWHTSLTKQLTTYKLVFLAMKQPLTKYILLFTKIVDFLQTVLLLKSAIHRLTVSLRQNV